MLLLALSETNNFLQAVAQKLKEAEITEQDSLLLVSCFEFYFILLIHSCVLVMDLKFSSRIIGVLIPELVESVCLPCCGM